ncbi:DNA cytosine methyltransferase, partial [Bifidobacterium breve]|uniref:DNA cytosine methyltransferase n=1 Tax=Bifidobacterium breve TaxID=1685 RepID=UPI0022AF8CA2
MAAEIRIAELFAGVGGFRLGLDGYGKKGDAFYMEPAGPFHTVWANQWEPTRRVVNSFCRFFLEKK